MLMDLSALGAAANVAPDPASRVSAVIHAIDIVTLVLFAVFTVCYLYQYIFIPIALFSKPGVPTAKK